MRKIDNEGLSLCDIQGRMFELSIDRFSCSSPIFIRRFANSKLATVFDNEEMSLSPKVLLDELEDECGPLTYGQDKYGHDEMYWIGYTYGYFCYTYGISMKAAYKLIGPGEMRDVYLPYHTMDCAQAIERILESKDISMDGDDLTNKAVRLLRKLRIRENLTLVELSNEYKDLLFDMMDEWTKEEPDNHTPWAIFKNDYHDFDNYLANLDIKEESNGKVPDSTYFALDARRHIFVGAVNIRHKLNEGLLLYGGHIGDGIRPSERNKGYGTQMIKLALNKCKALNINKVLMVCDSNNEWSRRTIVNNGGVLENTVTDDKGRVLERYWIKLS